MDGFNTFSGENTTTITGTTIPTCVSEGLQKELEAKANKIQKEGEAKLIVGKATAKKIKMEGKARLVYQKALAEREAAHADEKKAGAEKIRWDIEERKRDYEQHPNTIRRENKEYQKLIVKEANLGLHKKIFEANKKIFEANNKAKINNYLEKKDAKLTKKKKKLEYKKQIDQLERHRKENAHNDEVQNIKEKMERRIDLKKAAQKTFAQDLKWKKESTTKQRRAKTDTEIVETNFIIEDLERKTRATIRYQNAKVDIEILKLEASVAAELRFHKIKTEINSKFNTLHADRELLKLQREKIKKELEAETLALKIKAEIKLNDIEATMIEKKDREYIYRVLLEKL